MITIQKAGRYKRHKIPNQERAAKRPQKTQQRKERIMKAGR